AEHEVGGRDDRGDADEWIDRAVPEKWSRDVESDRADDDERDRRDDRCRGLLDPATHRPQEICADNRGGGEDEQQVLRKRSRDDRRPGEEARGWEEQRCSGFASRPFFDDGPRSRDATCDGGAAEERIAQEHPPQCRARGYLLNPTEIVGEDTLDER